MPYTGAIPVPETQIGLGFETERGVKVAPEYWIPVMAPKYKPDRKYLPDEGLRGSMTTIYDEIPSLRMDTHGWDQYPYMDSFGALLKALLGPDHKTAAPAETKLSEAAAKGATKIKTAASIAAGSWITLGTGPGSQETHHVKAVTGAGPYEVELYFPLIYAHANEAVVKGLTKHEFSLLNNEASEGNQPKSVTLTDGDGEENWRAIPDAMIDTLTLTGSAEALPKAALTWMGKVAETPSEPTPSYTTVEAPPGWTAVTAIGGEKVTVLMSWEIGFKRNLKPVPAITGTENYFQFFSGALDATGKIVLVEERDAKWLKAYEEGETEEIEISLYDIKSGFAFDMLASVCKFTTGELDRSKEWVEVPLTFQAIANTTDALSGGYSPVKCTVANATSTEY